MLVGVSVSKILEENHDLNREAFKINVLENICQKAGAGFKLASFSRLCVNTSRFKANKKVVW